MSPAQGPSGQAAEPVELKKSKICSILARLYRAGDYVSGQELCAQLGVTRTAIWKIINQLKAEGFGIESVPRRGYRLESFPDVMVPEAVGACLDTRWAGQVQCYYEETGSTNTEIRSLAEQGAPHGTLAVANAQNKGKGRRGRVWTMQPDTSIAMSLLLRPDFSPSHASMVTLVMGLAVARACTEVCGVDVRIKWPNDVVCGGRKISGILTELSTEVDYINYIVVGVGINCAQTSFPPEIADTATSLLLESGKPVNRARLIAACMKWFEHYYDTFAGDGDLSALSEEYNALLAGKGNTVRILTPGDEHTGISLGINQRGELLVQRPDGTIEEVYAGEVSVRGVYGYAGE